MDMPTAPDRMASSTWSCIRRISVGVGLRFWSPITARRMLLWPTSPQMLMVVPDCLSACR